MSIISRRRKTDTLPVPDQWQAEITRLQDKITAFKALQEVAHSLSSELNLNQLLAQILQSAADVMHASAGSLLLYDPLTRELVFQVVEGGSGESLRNKRFPCDQGIAGSVFMNREAAIVHDVQVDDRFLRIDEGTKFVATSLIAVPMIHKGDPIGVLEVLNKKSGERFNSDDQELLLAFAAHSAVAIENARLYQQVVADRDRVLFIEEQVRRELARDLHDGPSQLLSAIIMNVRFLREVMVRKPERTKEELDNLEQLSSSALQQVRNMLFNLRPVLLESQGLAPALKSYVDRQRENKDLEVLLDIDAFESRLDSKAEGAIFSIVQEAVGNIRKHAEAKHVWITARQQNRMMSIIIQDDGCGFDVQQVEAAYATRGSMGLLNMRERAEIAHAKLTIESAPGKGTKVSLRAPLGAPTK